MTTMVDIQKIRNIADEMLADSELFVVDIKCSPANEIELLIDSDASVAIDSCIELSKAIEAEFDREEEDFELTVASAGIGLPLKLFRQYRKLMGKSVEVVLKSGNKVLAQLQGVNEEGNAITLCYSEKVAVEGKKRKQEVEKIVEYSLDDIKSTVEYLDFK